MPTEVPRSGHETLRDVSAAALIRQLGKMQAEHGMVTVAAVIEGYLLGMSSLLQCELGPAVAYETLQRMCDAVAQRLADEFNTKEGSSTWPKS